MGRGKGRADDDDVRLTCQALIARRRPAPLPGA